MRPPRPSAPFRKSFHFLKGARANQNLGDSQVLIAETYTYELVLRPDITYHNVVDVKKLNERSTRLAS